MCSSIASRLVFIRNIAHLIDREHLKKCGKNRMFLKASAMESTGFFFETKEECKVPCVKTFL